ncbi:MAG TPA: S1-like domain-containing RNA-binding protein, partial [Dongiaceae bacterium]|nr:S1-like domain-containing RNA-binding protein [Dongiaceae bacterium]
LHTLKIARIDKKGVWLEAGDELAHLPLREAPQAMAGEQLEVFLYQVIPGELQATLRPPLAQAGEFATLKVKSITAHGAFLDWGLAKDLLVPMTLQPERMQVNWSYLVKIDVDQQGRPFGNARIDECLDHGQPDLHEGDAVDLIIWQLTELGAKVIVNNRFPALLYRDELPAGSFTGMEIPGYIKRLRDDGKLDVTLRRVGPEGVSDGRDVILKVLAANGGSLPLHDKSSPSVIQRILGMSKKTFKKAVGGLYKDGLVSLTAEGISLTAKGSAPVK